MEKVLLSIVTPVYGGAVYLDDLVAAMDRVRDELEMEGEPLELGEAIFVDDGSTDGSATVLSRLQEQHAWIKIVTLSRNFGQHPATVAGILHSSGDWVATLDEDLQHPPAQLVPLLVHAVETGSDVAYARPVGGVHESAFRNASSRTYKLLVSRLAGNAHVRMFNSFRMMRGSVARAAAAVSTHDTYFDIALCWFTNRVNSLPMELKDPRRDRAGGSGYSLRSLLRHARRMLISSDVKLLRAGFLVGAGALATSLVASLSTLALWFFHPDLFELNRGWLSLFLAILFFGGLTALLVGIVLEYISTLLRLAQGHPTFFVVDRSRDRLLEPFIARRRQT
jgi:glycosyltransferase involved in cell wall biosynthesis